MREAIFIDRDGVILKQKHHLHKKEDLKLILDSDKAIKLLNKNDYVTIVVTNQSVIARGLCTMQEVEELNNYMKKILEDRGAIIDKIYFCPHHPTEGNSEYTKECNCRKPKIGMLLRAKQELGICLKESYVIGDQTSDIKMGKDAGCKTILVKTGYGRNNELNSGVIPTFTAKNLYDAVLHLLKK